MGRAHTKGRLEVAQAVDEPPPRKRKQPDRFQPPAFLQHQTVEAAVEAAAKQQAAVATAYDSLGVVVQLGGNLGRLWHSLPGFAPPPDERARFIDLVQQFRDADADEVRAAGVAGAQRFASPPQPADPRCRQGAARKSKGCPAKVAKVWRKSAKCCDNMRKYSDVC